MRGLHHGNRPPNGARFVMQSHLAHLPPARLLRPAADDPALVDAPVVHASDAPVVHAQKTEGEDRYRDRDARREYRREWMRSKRVEAK
jgi:hypothetical protein